MPITHTQQKEQLDEKYKDREGKYRVGFVKEMKKAAKEKPTNVFVIKKNFLKELNNE